MAKITAAFQGERGAFSEDAAARVLAGEIDPAPRSTFEDMFAAVATGAADCALAPIENTLAGSIMKNYDLLVEHELVIVGEVVLRVVHNLIARPGAKLDEIKRIYSHPIALAQCERFLAARRHVEVVPAQDTAGSVKMIMAGGRSDEAAVAGRSAAATYGAEILVEGIESNAQNFTRFFVVARPDRAAAVPLRADVSKRKTSIVFRLPNKPGGLYRSLAGFAEENVDLTFIASRPIEGRPWEYSFYADFLGHRDDPPVHRALARLLAIAESLRILGSYPKAADS